MPLRLGFPAGVRGIPARSLAGKGKHRANKDNDNAESRCSVHHAEVHESVYVKSAETAASYLAGEAARVFSCARAPESTLAIP